MYFKIVLSLILSLLISSVYSLDLCENHKNCDKCIMDPNNCVWCAEVKNFYFILNAYLKKFKAKQMLLLV